MNEARELYVLLEAAAVVATAAGCCWCCLVLLRGVVFRTAVCYFLMARCSTYIPGRGQQPRSFSSTGNSSRKISGLRQ